MKRLLAFVLRRHQPDIDALSAHLDGALDASATAALESHLAACAACHARLDELRAVRARLRAMPAAEPPRSFRLAQADARAPAPRAPAPRIVRFAPALSAAAALVFAVTVVVDVYSSGGRSGSVALQSAKAPQAQRAVPAPGTAGAAAPAEGASGSAVPYAGDAANPGSRGVSSPLSGTTMNAGAAPAPATPPGGKAGESNGPAGEPPTGNAALSSRGQTRSTGGGGTSDGRIALRVIEALVAAVALGAGAVAVRARMKGRGATR